MRKNYLYKLMFWMILGWILAAVFMNRFFVIHLIDYTMLYEQTRPEPDFFAGGTKSILWVLFYRGLETLGILWLCKGEKGRWTVPMLMALAGFLGSTALLLCIWNYKWWGIFIFIKEYLFLAAPFYAFWYILILRFGVIR